MAGNLYLRLAGPNASWLVRGPDLFRSEERGAVAEAAAHAAGNRVTVLVPGADLLLTHARLPTRQRQRLRQAVPFAVEEQLSDEVENLHFAVGSDLRGDEGVPVAVVARERMRHWLEGLTAAGLHPSALVPDLLALPLAPGEWSLLLDDAGILLRSGATKGCALDPGNLDTLLAIAFGQAGEARPERLRVFDCRKDQDESLQRVSEAARAWQVEVEVESCPEGALGLLARSLSRPAAIDLLQGEFSRREQLGKLWRPWRPAAILAGVLLLLQGAMGLHAYYTLSGESEALAAQIEQVYRKAFPEAKVVVDPRVQMERHLAELRGGASGGGFVPLMARSGPVIDAVAGLELSALRYKEGVLEIDFTVADFETLERLKQELSGKGLGVEIQSASARSGRVEARLKVREERP